jgi:hypothetical protein
LLPHKEIYPFNEWVLGHVQIYARQVGGVLEIDPDRLRCAVQRHGIIVFEWKAGHEPRFRVGQTLMSLGEYTHALSKVMNALSGLLSEADFSQAMDDAIDNYLNGGSDGDASDSNG